MVENIWWVNMHASTVDGLVEEKRSANTKLIGRRFEGKDG